jgi:carbon storage regulator CsrA
MLVLSRKIYESIIIDESIVVVVVEILGGKVQIGVSCASDMPVYKKEAPPQGISESFRSYRGETSGILEFSRKNEESLCIGNDISIVVIDIQSEMVRLGIECPKDVTIRRS